MEKLLFFPFVLFLVFVSAQPDVKSNISDANESFTFALPVSTANLLASWTSDINDEITFELEFNDLRTNHWRHLKSTKYSILSNTLNFFRIERYKWGVIIDPNNRRYGVSSPWNLRIIIKSTRKTYWRLCASQYQCDLPTPVHPATECTKDSTTQNTSDSPAVTTKCTRDSTLDFTSIVLLSISCVLGAIVIGMAVYILRGKRSPLNEPGRISEREDTSTILKFDSSNFSRVEEDHESINSLYGAVIVRELPE